LWSNDFEKVFVEAQHVVVREKNHRLEARLRRKGLLRAYLFMADLMLISR
jgi:hypothetical protein